MKLQLISDTHFNFQRQPLTKFDTWRDPSADLVVLAGDSTEIKSTEVAQEVINFLARWPRAIWVMGNHEYYMRSPRAVECYIASAVIPPNVEVVTEPRLVYINGWQFYCGTGWYRRAAVAAVADADTSLYREGNTLYRFSDYEHINDLVPWVYDQAEAFDVLLRTMPTDTKTVVVSHHLPNRRSTPPQFANDISNVWFLSDKTQIIRSKKPALWLHGHTHTACDYKIGPTRVVANPHGYPHERKSIYVPQLIEV